MLGLESCPRLTMIDGVDCAGLVDGSLNKLCLSGICEEVGLALSAARRYLARSASTLEILDLRCGSIMFYLVGSLGFVKNQLRYSILLQGKFDRNRGMEHSDGWAGRMQQTHITKWNSVLWPCIRRAS